MAKVTLSYEFDADEEWSNLKQAVLAQDAVSVLIDLDNEIRGKLKYGEEDWIIGGEEFLCKLRSIIWDSKLLEE